MKRIRSILITVVAFAAIVSCALLQPRPEWPDIWSQSAEELYETGNFLFDDSVVRKIEITMDQRALNAVARGHYTSDGKKRYALAKALSFDGEVIEHVGIRSRGGSSGGNYKRQFKISFNAHTTYTDRDESARVYNRNMHGRTFHGVRKLNLRASANDPVIIREHVAGQIFREAGAIVPRSAFAELHINGDYWGLYIITEQIDRAFLQSRFGRRKQPLFKGIKGASRFLPLYTNSGFALKSKHHEDSSALREFFTVLENGLPDSTMLTNYVDVDNVLSYLAACTLTGHWDSFAVLGNNDYLYKGKDERFRIIGWDFDNTFGSGKAWGFPVRESTVFGLKTRMTEQTRVLIQTTNYDVLFDHILNHPEWRVQYIQKVERLLAEVFNPEEMTSRIEGWRALIRDSVYRDSRRLRDWHQEDLDQANVHWEQGFTQKPDDWHNHGCGYDGFGEYKGGLLGWIEDRYTIVRRQLEELE